MGVDRLWYELEVRTCHATRSLGPGFVIETRVIGICPKTRFNSNGVQL